MLICSVRFESNALKRIVFLENRMFQSIGKEKRKIFFGKVEKILKGSLDSIPSPSTSAKIHYWPESLLQVMRQKAVG